MAGATRREYAGIVSRAVAYLIDAGIVAILALGTLGVFELVALALYTSDAVRALDPVLLSLVPAGLAIYTAFFWALAGRTPGMALLGLRVVRTSGVAVSWLSSVIRALVLAYFPIGALWCLVDRRRQAVHDKLARTVVVRAVPDLREPAPASHPL